ncbi:hypothetical protein N4P33_13850 [Streptomyces sp. 15-116A]|nr:hypothetical protein [Streptomyces sp. 15-116A]MCT7353250.1 hypothetical protein [Streptomyces sp. 15-116A]
MLVTCNSLPAADTVTVQVGVGAAGKSASPVTRGDLTPTAPAVS